MRAAWLVALLGAGCATHPCDHLSGSCLDLTIKGTSTIDQFAITLSGAVNDTRTTPSQPKRATLPQELGIHFGGDSVFGTLGIDVIGLRDGNRIGSGSTMITLRAGQHENATLSFVPDTSTLTPIALVPATAVDLLLVVDNSPGMLPKQQALSTALPLFVGALSSMTAASYHLGVITTDLGAGNVALAQCHVGGDGGRLQSKGAAAPAGCMPPSGGVNFLRFDTANKTSNAPPGQNEGQTLTCMAAVGESGCGFEMPLQSAYVALRVQPAENHDFLRSDALLVVEFITDEDDCSADANTDLFAPASTQYGPLVSYRCTQSSIVCGMPPTRPPSTVSGPLTDCRDADPPDNKLIPVSKFVNVFSQPAEKGGLKNDPSKVLLGSIAAPPVPFSVILANPSPSPPGPYATCAVPSDTTCTAVLQRSCIAPTNPELYGDPAVRLNQVVSAAANPTTGSICELNYVAHLQQLAARIDEQLQAHGCLPRPPVNPAAPRCEVTLADGTDVPECGAAGRPCWELVAATGCAGGYQLQLQPSAPNGTLAACELAR